jgi:hypothetical protein
MSCLNDVSQFTTNLNISENGGHRPDRRQPVIGLQDPRFTNPRRRAAFLKAPESWHPVVATMRGLPRQPDAARHARSAAPWG